MNQRCVRSGDQTGDESRLPLVTPVNVSLVAAQIRPSRANRIVPLNWARSELSGTPIGLDGFGVGEAPVVTVAEPPTAPTGRAKRSSAALPTTRATRTTAATIRANVGPGRAADGPRPLGGIGARGDGRVVTEPLRNGRM